MYMHGMAWHREAFYMPSMSQAHTRIEAAVFFGKCYPWVGGQKGAGMIVTAWLALCGAY